MTKKAEATAGNATSLIAVIALLLIFYILFVPPDVRNSLLNGTDTSNALLHSTIGRLDPVTARAFTYTLPQTTLQEIKNAATLTTQPPFQIFKGIFEEQRHTTTFELTNLQNTENINLLLKTPTHDGTLTITINGITVYGAAITQAQPDPIPLPKRVLTGNNTITFSVSSPGIKFWTTHQYDIDSMRIIGDITDVTKQTLDNTFVLSNAEKNNIATAKLTYTAICNQDKIGTLTIELNNNLISNTAPRCGEKQTHQLTPEDFTTGKNTIFFKLNNGMITLNNIRINTTLSPTATYTDSFTATQANIRNTLLLTIQFSDPTTSKQATITINSNTFTMNTNTQLYQKDITALATPGNNQITITPHTSMTIKQLLVQPRD